MCSRTQAVGGLGSTPEATLFRQAQAGCRDSLNLLMARHDGLVQAVVRRYGFGDLAFTEAVHLGRIGLWRAILHYTPERGLAFSTYAWPCIRNEILHVTRAQVGRKEWPMLSLAVLSDQELDTLIEQETRMRQDLLQLVGCLPERLRYVIVAYYGLDGQPGSTYAAIGAQLGLTKQRVCQLRTEALVWLRQPARSQTLRSLLDRHTVADYQWADDLAQRWLQRRGGRYGRGTHRG
jgi:RNA polymerase sigma factor (sigma-70 family)